MYIKHLFTKYLCCLGWKIRCVKTHEVQDFQICSNVPRVIIVEFVATYQVQVRYQNFHYQKIEFYYSSLPSLF